MEQIFIGILVCIGSLPAGIIIEWRGFPVLSWIVMISLLGIGVVIAFDLIHFFPCPHRPKWTKWEESWSISGVSSFTNQEADYVTKTRNCLVCKKEDKEFIRVA